MHPGGVGDRFAEMTRVTADGGRVVVLAPKIPRGIVPAGLTLLEQHVVQLLGTRTSLWCYEKQPGSSHERP